MEHTHSRIFKHFVIALLIVIACDLTHAMLTAQDLPADNIHTDDSSMMLACGTATLQDTDSESHIFLTMAALNGV